MHMNELVSHGIEYKITQDKGTHANAPSLVIPVVSAPFQEAMHVLPSSCRCGSRRLECGMLLPPIHKYIHATMGSVQLSIANLGPFNIAKPKGIQMPSFEMIIAPDRKSVV